jgi:hypothetical protein
MMCWVGVQVAGLDVHCGPHSRDQRRLELRAALAHAGAAAFAGALVTARAQASAGHKVPVLYG